MTLTSLQQKSLQRTLTVIGAAVLIIAVTLYLALPVAALFFRTDSGTLLLVPVRPGCPKRSLAEPGNFSYLTRYRRSCGHTICVCPQPKYVPGKMVVDTLIDLPLVLPPAVAGLALLVLYGRVGFVGRHLNMFGITLAFTTLAVIMAQIFVASPFYLRQAKSLFEQLDPAYEHTARTLGASPLRILITITIPLTASGLVSGAVMTFGRVLVSSGQRSCLPVTSRE